MIKNLSNSSLKIILNFCNKLWETDEIIISWKTPLVIPMCKESANENQLESYRPISLTPVMCKLMERLVNKRLIWFLESNNLLKNNQTGFLKIKKLC